MERPISLDRLFKEKIFRIPDYQRGYAWQKDHLKAFWEDLINLRGGKTHYTGLLTFTTVDDSSIKSDSKDYWLVHDHSYRVHHVVDGQQRLTTCVIFLQAFVEFMRALPEHQQLPADQVYVNDSLTVDDVESRYLFKVNPKAGFRTYKFGYTEDNPSQEYLRYRVLNEAGGGAAQETFYTLNLGNAKLYFQGQLAELHLRSGKAGLAEIYRKLTMQLLFNEYAADKDFDEFVAFETMNNRGKKLSDLELLKNRLIYLTTLYDDSQLDKAGSSDLRNEINAAWKEVYHQLGRNKARPLNDDDFLRVHWITYFKYSRQSGRDYAKFLLDVHFIAQHVHTQIGRDIALELAEEQRAEMESEVLDDEPTVPGDVVAQVPTSKLGHASIREYVLSLREMAGYWFTSFFPYLDCRLIHAEKQAVDRLNRIGMGYFRPLVMVVLKKIPQPSERLEIFARIERFIFIAFRMGSARSNYRSSEFYNLARALDRGETTLAAIAKRLDVALDYAFREDGTLRIEEFHSQLFRKFEQGSGYYGWAGLRYFLFEYEQQLLSGSRQSKVEWADLLKSGSDRISIEHIYPQTPGSAWEPAFAELSAKERNRYAGMLGNLLLLSMSVNSTLQNGGFDVKKQPVWDASGRKIRNGYSDGSHSEIEVAAKSAWGPAEIRERSEALLNFMARRWNFDLRDEDRSRLLFVQA